MTNHALGDFQLFLRKNVYPPPDPPKRPTVEGDNKLAIHPIGTLKGISEYPKISPSLSPKVAPKYL